MTGRKSAAFNRAPGFVLGVVWCALAWSPGFAQDAKTKTLIQQLQSPEQFARMAAAGKVAELGPGAADAAPALIEALKCERMDVMFENPQIAASRRSFADSLVRLGSPVTPQIEQALNDANGLVRVWSAYALFKIDSVKHRGKVVRALMDSLREDDDTAADAAMVLELMGSDAAPAIPLLIQQLAHADLGVRCNSAHALVAIAKGDQLRPLTEALKHEQPLVRVGAAYVLQRGQRDLSVDAKIVLQEALDNEASAVRTQAVWAIGQLGSVAQPLAKPLIAVLPRLNPDIREYFFGGGGLGRQSFDPSMVLVATGPKTKEDLIQALEGEDLKGRLMAAVALLRLDPSQKERVDTVFAAVREAPDQSLRFFANLSAPPVAPAAKPDLEGLIREVLQTNGFGPPSPAAFQLAQRGAEAVGPLMEILKQGDGVAAQRVSGVLAMIGEPALPVLNEAMNSDNAQLRVFAVGALGGMGPPAVPVLTKALKDDEFPVRRAARFALKSIGSPEALDALRKSDGGR